MPTIDWLNQEWTLLAEKALHWPARRAVIVADVHLGKAAAFRHHGVPVPEATTARDLARLSAIVHSTRCERLFVLGDLLHARHGRADATMRAVSAWRARNASVDITLVRGNHDLAAGDPPDEWNIRCVDEPHAEDGIEFRHAPREGRGDSPHIAGHVHPCVRMRDVDGSTMRAACFVFSARAALLPAFGSFTGTHPVRPREGDRVFAVGDGCVAEIAGAIA